MAELLPEALEELAGESEITSSVVEAENASAEIQQSAKDYEQASKEEAESSRDAMEALSGKVKYEDLSDSAKKFFDEQKPNVQKQMNTINKIVDALVKEDPEPLDLKVGDDLPDPKSSDPETARKGQKIEKAINKATNNLNDDTLNDIKSRLDKMTKESTGEKLVRYIKYTSVIGTIVAGVAEGIAIYEILRRMGADESGCYVSSTSSDHLLKPELVGHNCKNLSDICNCSAETSSSTIPSQINAKCGSGTADTSRSCANDYVYNWKNVTWIDALSNIINALINAAAGGAEGLEALIEWVTKNGKWIAIAIAVLVILFLAGKFIPLRRANTVKNIA
jgi:myosin heavy subunit